MKDLSQRAKRLYFVVGIGFAALMLGSILSVLLLQRLGPRLHGAPVVLLFFLEVLLRNLWSLLVLPILAYGAARAVPLGTWSTVVGALATGEVFVRALRYIQGGADVVWGSWSGFATGVAVLCASAALTRLAILRGREAAEVQLAEAQARARAKVSEYDEFVQAAERQGERNALAERERALGEVAGVPAAGGAQTPPPVQAITEPASTTGAPATAGPSAITEPPSTTGAPDTDAPQAITEPLRTGDAPQALTEPLRTGDAPRAITELLSTTGAPATDAPPADAPFASDVGPDVRSSDDAAADGPAETPRVKSS